MRGRTSSASGALLLIGAAVILGQRHAAGLLTAALIIVLIAVGALLTRSALRVAWRRQRDRRYVRSGLAAIDVMSGVQFELYVAARLRQAGWTVTTTATTGDYGVDLIAAQRGGQRGGRRIAIQCKRYRKPVGSRSRPSFRARPTTDARAAPW
jgi:HJR/Mrr/RecB family endonuclease